MVNRGGVTGNMWKMPYFDTFDITKLRECVSTRAPTAAAFPARCPTRARAMRDLQGLALYLVLLTVPDSAQALDVNATPLAVLGDGSTTCGEFTAIPGLQDAKTQWVLGYISGRNKEGQTPQERKIGLSLRKPGTALGWLQSYCNSHSLNILAQAADDLRADFQAHESR
jgi:hypothetical protein